MSNTVTITALETRNLDTICYRGSAPLSALESISQADVYDQVTNPQGLQRELNRRHAADAHAYTAAPRDMARPRAYPEVILNVRDKRVVEREVIFDGGDARLVTLTFDLDKLAAARTVKVSRVDGNHRLFYGNGDGKDRKPIHLDAPFQVHIGLAREQETDVFATVNSEAKGLNTSHLATLRSRITPADVEREQHPARAIAMQLVDDPASPWHGLVHMGGSKVGTKEAGEKRPVSFITLEHGVQRILRKSQYINEREFDARYGLIRNFWQAVAAVYPEAFSEPGEWLVLKNLGVQVFSQLAATVIDRCLIAGNVEVGHMVPFLQAAKDAIDWHKDSTDVAGMSGNRAVLLLVGRMSDALPKTAEEYADVYAAA